MAKRSKVQAGAAAKTDKPAKATATVEPMKQAKGDVKKEPARAAALVPRAREAAIPALEARNPFTLFRRFTEDVDRLFADFRLGAASMFLPRELPEGAWVPAVELVERGGKLVVRADLPGLAKKDVRIEVRDDAVCITGERRFQR